MSLSVGARLGPYEIQAPLGAGGMGEVYRARDTRLDRDVAIKVLPADMATDPDRLARFEREARAVSALNHPNIVTLHEVGTSDAGPYLVLERVEGESLRQVIAAGPLPLRRLLDVGAQVAAGLAKAHEAGIVHRDLKPANVMVTTDGFVKILDFGLARLVWPEDARNDADTVTFANQTASGAVLGTPGYLSPEQAAGKPADERADQFALGALLYELATGTRPFKRPTIVETLAATIQHEPQPVRAARPDLPGPLVWIIERCLAKNPEDRYGSTKDLARDLATLRDRINELSADVGAEAPPQSAAPRGPGRWLGLIAAMAATVIVGGAVWFLKPAPPAPALHLALTPPRDSQFVVGRNVEGGLAVSPDGRMLAFVGSTNAKSQLWIRRFATADAYAIAGSDGAQQPFWSPDSRQVAFYTPDKLLRVVVDSGSVQTIADVDPRTTGGAWFPGEVLLVTGRPGFGIHRISEGGGDSAPVVAGDWPSPLPGGKRFLYTGTDGLWIGSLDPSEAPRQISGLPRSRAVFSSGHILFVRDRTLMALPYDAARLEAIGEAYPIAESLLTAAASTSGVGTQASFSAAEHGMLVYAAGHRATRLRWRDRKGTLLGEIGTSGENLTPRIAPDGRRVAFARAESGATDLWIADEGRSSDFHLTFDPGLERYPIWSPDGSTVTYSSGTPGKLHVVRRAADGSGTAEQLTAEPASQHAMDWSTDGRYLALTRNEPAFGTDLRILPVPGDGAPYLFLRTNASEGHNQFSPGAPPRWIAYSSDDTGSRREIWVAAFLPGQPMSGARWQISQDGGTMPRWRGDGGELYYWALDGRIMAVSVDGTGAAFRSSTPVALFTTHPPSLRTNDIEFDVTRDGGRFVLVEPAERTTFQPLTVVTNWLATVRR